MIPARSPRLARPAGPGSSPASYRFSAVNSALWSSASTHRS